MYSSNSPTTSICFSLTNTSDERQILEAIQHPFIVRLYYAFQTSHKLYLILGYAMGGELFSYLARERMFREEWVQFYAAEVFKTKTFFHLSFLCLISLSLCLISLCVSNLSLSV